MNVSRKAVLLALPNPAAIGPLPLAPLAGSAGRVKTRVRLLLEVFDRSIGAHISTLRGKRNDDPRDPRSIETIRGAGRRFRNA